MNILNKLDKLLNEEKENLDRLSIPEDMEERLRSALNNVPSKKKKRFQIRVAAIIIVLLLSYNIDTLAFYSKKLIGYDDIMNGTLQELNEMGKGQVINKSHTFKDGVSVVLDGVMLDDNNMILFYTIHDPYGDVQNKNINISIGGIFSQYSYSGSGIASPDGKTESWVINTHEVPMFFEKTISLNINYQKDDGNYEEGKITFKLDRTQAVGKSIKFNINKKIELGYRSISVDTMVASPTSTIVRGKIQNILELGIDIIKDKRIRPLEIEMELLADGRKIDHQGGGLSTDNKGSSFYITFDALPQDTKNIELRLVSFAGDYDVKEAIELEKGKGTRFKVLEQDVIINAVYEENGSTYINFTTEDTVQLSRVYLNIDGKRHELQETIYGSEEKVAKDNKVKILYTRTMRFEGTGDKLELDIQRVRYNKVYDELIYKE